MQDSASRILATDIRSHDGTFSAWLARPNAPRAPGIVFVPSIFGVTDEALRWVREAIAGEFFALLYDPFWRTDPGPLAPTVEVERARAAARRDAVSVDACVADLGAGIERLRAEPGCNGRIAVVGYCFGGRYAFIAAAQLPIDAAVAYHGIKIGESLDVAAAIRVPVSLHCGDSDPSAPMAEVEAIRAATRDNPLVDLCVYPGVGHSFTWRGYRLYDEGAAQRSEAVASALLATLRQ